MPSTNSALVNWTDKRQSSVGRKGLCKVRSSRVADLVAAEEELREATMTSSITENCPKDTTVKHSTPVQTSVNTWLAAIALASATAPVSPIWLLARDSCIEQIKNHQ